MQKYNPNNERIKKEYFRYLKEADRKADSSIDEVRKAILRYESYNNLKDFKTFNRQQATAFKKHLSTAKAERTGAPLAKSTLYSTTNALKRFFKWLSCQPGYKSHVNVTDVEYLNLSEKDIRVAKQPPVKNYPTLAQIKAVVLAMPTRTDIEMRDRALFAFTIVTGMRDNAIASLRLKHVDIYRERVIQDPREVRTKFSKQIITYFFPVGVELKAIVNEWISYLRKDLLYRDDDPVFPQTRIVHDENRSFAANGLGPTFWANAAPIRKIFRETFTAHGITYFNPHSFRDTLVQLGKQRCKTPEAFEAWSKNLGHEQMLTTFRSYGSIDPNRQGELIKSLGADQDEEDKLDRLMQMVERIEAGRP
jgi:integrase/recombinase XerD